MRACVRLRSAGASVLLLLCLIAWPEGRATVAPVVYRAPERIVVLAPHAVEMIYLLGAGERIVATVSHADHPLAAREIPRIGDAFALSLEALVAVRPDLVVAWGGALDAQRRARLESLVPAVWVSDPSNLADVATELEALAEMLGIGAPVARVFRERLDALRAPPRATPLRVLPLVSLDPPLTMGTGTFVDDVLRRCGAVNPMAGDAGVVRQVSREALLATDLDLVLPLLDSDADLARLPALVGDDAVIARIDADLLARPGPRLLEGAERLCALFGERS